MLGGQVEEMLSDIQGIGALMRIGRLIETHPELEAQIKTASRKLAADLCGVPVESITDDNPPAAPDSIRRLQMYRAAVGEDMWQSIQSNSNLETMCDRWWKERVIEVIKQICDDTHKAITSVGVDDVSLDDVKVAFRVLLKDQLGI